jgi:hypothetical protein
MGEPIPPSPAPREATATAQVRAQVRETRVAAAKAVVPSLVRESAVITTVLSQWSPWANVYFDEERLWFAYGNQLIAFDPKSQDVIVGPIVLNEDVVDMVFDGKQLWISEVSSSPLARLRPINVTSGTVGPAIEVGNFGHRLVYDGHQLWFDTLVPRAGGGTSKHALQAIDPASQRIFSPIETEGDIDDLVADKARQVLWIINSDGKVQQYDLQQNVLRTTSLQFRPDIVGFVHFDGQRLWTVRSISWPTGSIGQSLDVDTGETTDLASSTWRAISTVLVDKQIWFGKEDFTVQPIDMATGQLRPAIPVYGEPVDLEFDGQRLWILQRDECDGRYCLLLQYLVPND